MRGLLKIKKKKRLIDIKNNNLHVATNSISVNKEFKINDLRKKIFFSKKLKSAIPYRTMYYKRDWAFCVNKKQYKKILSENNLKVCIKSKFKNGKLNIGEILIPGISKKEILISTYICHPSLGNDNLSGILLTTLLENYLQGIRNYWSYRIVFLPETIGAIAYLNLREQQIKKNVIGGFVITCVGGDQNFSFKMSFNKDHFLNHIVEKILLKKKLNFKKYSFDINGSDERQYSSQGFGINIVSLFKGKYYEYKEYHTSKDDLNFIKIKNILSTFDIYTKVINHLESEKIYKSIKTHGEIMLKKYKFDNSEGGSFLPSNKSKSLSEIILWLNFILDGTLSIEQVSNKIQINLKELKKIISLLETKKIIKRL